MREQDDRAAPPGEADGEVRADAARKLRLAIPRRSGRALVRNDRSAGSASTASDEERPAGRAGARQAPAGERASRTSRARERLRRRLSSIFQRPMSGIALRAAGLGARPAAEDPGQQLPVAARPSGAGARRRPRSGAGKSSKSSMSETRPARAKSPSNRSWREQRVLGHPAGERALERVDVVDALARVDPLAEEVLVDVGDREGVGIDAARAREDALEERAAARSRAAWASPAAGGSRARPRRGRARRRRRAGSAGARSSRRAARAASRGSACRRRA